MARAFSVLAFLRNLANSEFSLKDSSDDEVASDEEPDVPCPDSDSSESEEEALGFVEETKSNRDAAALGCGFFMRASSKSDDIATMEPGNLQLPNECP